MRIFPRLSRASGNLLALLALAACAAATQSLTEAQLRVYPDAAGMPADVQDFIVRWQDCSHWLGEVGEEEPRRRQIERAVRDVCPGVDALGRRVRARHADRPDVLARIASYEPLGQ